MIPLFAAGTATPVVATTGLFDPFGAAVQESVTRLPHSLRYLLLVTGLIRYSRTVKSFYMVVERHSLFQAEIKAIVTNGMQFLASLEFTPREGLPQEKLVALCQCIDRIHIAKPANQIKLAFRAIPSASLQAIAHCEISMADTNVMAN